jgi:enolase
MTAEIVVVHAREVFDSRGRPTVEAEVSCRGGRPARAIAPSGASTGRAEALEVRDGGQRLGGWGVRQAVHNVRELIAPALLGCDASEQTAIDQRMIDLDGTSNKQRLGANAILAVSLATAYAAADALGRSIIDHLHELWQAQKPGHSDRSAFKQKGPSDREAGPTESPGVIGAAPSLPLPMVNMVSGGLHAGGQIEFQDFLIVPVGAATFSEALEWVVTVYQQLGRTLKAAGSEGSLVGDEGGYGPKLRSNEEAIHVVLRAIEQAGLRPGQEVALALDVAASHFYEGGHYKLPSACQTPITADAMIELLAEWVRQYPLLSIEDPLAEDDWDGWRLITQQLGDRVQLLGDDVFATNPARLRRGIDSQAANAVLIKLNQIGTLTETLQTLQLAIEHGYRPVISARSGETEDVTIADLAVAAGAGQIKIGSVARSERLAKYNQLLRWEEASSGRWPFVKCSPLEKWLR